MIEMGVSPERVVRRLDMTVFSSCPAFASLPAVFAEKRSFLFVILLVWQKQEIEMQYMNLEWK